MQPVIDSIVVLRDSLQDALSRQDWEAIGELDKQSRVLVAEVVAGDTWENSALREQIARLSVLYEQLQQSGRAERERIAGELTRINQAKQINKAYKPQG